MTKELILGNAKYQEALMRADRDGIEVVGKVFDKAHAFVGYAVQGSRGGCYLVRQEGMNMICSCPATQPCKHRAIVTRRMMEDKAAETTIAQDAALALAAARVQRKDAVRQSRKVIRDTVSMMPRLHAASGVCFLR